MKTLRQFSWLAAVLGICLLQGCTTAYSARAIDATVVDTRTGAPVEGAIVIAHWILHFGLEGGSGTDLVLLETVTGRDGRFHFPAWGPVPIPAKLPFEARLKAQDPEIVIFKEGYDTRVLSNDRPMSSFANAGPSMRTSDWHGKTIALAPFVGTREYYGVMLGGVLVNINAGPCTFMKIPRLTSALIKAGERLRQERVYYDLITLARVESATARECGSVQEYFKEYLK